MPVLVQAVSLLGAGLVLGAFSALQRGRWRPDGRPYLWCNLLGAGLLSLVAFWDRRLGFIVLEGAWAAIAAASLWRVRALP
jgi:hypothetical protein